MNLLNIAVIIFVVCMILLLVFLCWILCAIQKKYEDAIYENNDNREENQK